MARNRVADVREISCSKQDCPKHYLDDTLNPILIKHQSNKKKKFIQISNTNVADILIFTIAFALFSDNNAVSVSLIYFFCLLLNFLESLC